MEQPNLNQSFGGEGRIKPQQQVSFQHNNNMSSNSSFNQGLAKGNLQDKVNELQREVKDLQFELSQQQDTIAMKQETIRSLHEQLETIRRS